MPGRAGTSTVGRPSSRASAAGMQRPGAAEGEQREIARVVAARRPRPCGSRRPSCMLPSRSTAPAACDRRRARPACRSSPRRSRATCSTVDRRVDRQQPLRVEPPEQQIGVGDRRLRAAAAVADRARAGAGAFRPDLDQPGGVDAGDRAAAGADRVHGHHRHMDRHGIFDLDLVGDRRLGVADQRHVGRGAAHVVGDEVVEAGAPARIGGGDDAGGRARHHGLRRLARHEAGRDHAAIAVHDQEVARVAARLPVRRAAARRSARGSAAPRR